MDITGSRDDAVVRALASHHVDRVRFPDSASYVGCWLSSLLREVFLRVLRFSPLLKNQHFHIPIRCGVSTYCKEHLFISSWNYALYKFTNLIAKKLCPLDTGGLSIGKPNKILLKKKLERGGLGNRSLKWTSIPSRQNYIMATVASYQGNRSIEREM